MSKLLLWLVGKVIKRCKHKVHDTWGCKFESCVPIKFLLIFFLLKLKNDGWEMMHVNIFKKSTIKKKYMITSMLIIINNFPTKIWQKYW